jgi:hypothetical protein
LLHSLSARIIFDVIGHLDLPGISVSYIHTSAHWTHTFLELSDYQHHTLIAVNVTDPTRPMEVKQLTLPALPTGVDVEAMTGNIALLTENASLSVNAPESISIVDFKDPSHPITVRRFDKVTAFPKDSGGIIYITGAAYGY